MAPRVTLYDFSGVSTPSTPWNPNVFKSRLLLHAKGIPFETNWQTYTKLAGTLKAEGFEGKGDKPTHTVPLIKVEDGGEPEFVMDSENIAKRLEELFPGQGLKVDQSAQIYKRADEAVNTMLGKIFPVIVWHVPNQHIVHDKDGVDYFIRTREERFGKTFEQLHAAFEPSWEAAAPEVEKVGNMLLEKPGPYLEGSTPTYGDVRIVAVLAYFFVTDPALFDRLLSLDEHGGLKKLWSATNAWRPELEHAKTD